MLRQGVPLETARLLLRPFSQSDHETASLLHSDPEVTKYTGGLRSREHSSATLARWIERFNSRGWGPLAVAEREGSDLVGWCGIQPLTHTQDFELFFGYTPSVWGRGYATEAGKALVAAGFETLSVDRIVARAHDENLASQRVLEKIGMTKLHTVFNDIYGGIVSLFAIEKG